MGKFPTIEQIRNDYSELMKIIEGVRTIEQAKEFMQKHKIPVEINGLSIDEYVNGLMTIYGRASNRGTNEEINYIRYEYYGCLCYIYDEFNGKPMFDVEYDDGEIFATNIIIDDVTEELYAMWVNEANKVRRN